jgi:hypothetical protein
MSTADIALIVAVLFFGGIVGYFLGRRRFTSRTTAPSNVIANDAEGISIRAIDADMMRNLEPLNIRGETVAKLSSLIEHIPGAGVSVTTAVGRFYELSFSPTIVQRLDGGSATLMQSLHGGVRANAVDQGGRIVGQGSLHPVEFLKTAAAAAAVWQVLSVAVAQKHLADIQKHLQDIASGVRGIQKWLQLDQRGKLEGNLEYLSTIAECFLEGHISEHDLQRYRAQLEDIDRETIQIARSLELEFSQLQSRLPGIRLTEWFGTKHDTETIRTEIHEHERISKAWFLAMHVRAAACQLTCAMPGERQVAERRLQAIQEALQGCEQWKASTPLFRDLIEKRLDSPWNLKSTLHDRRSQLLVEVESLHQSVVEYESRITVNLTRIRNKLVAGDNSLNSPLRIAVETDSAGKLIRASRFIDGPA